ncbi:hypothetical protein GCM10020358_77880 [Amorphoplanes nipponensis]
MGHEPSELRGAALASGELALMKPPATAPATGRGQRLLGLLLLLGHDGDLLGLFLDLQVDGPLGLLGGGQGVAVAGQRLAVELGHLVQPQRAFHERVRRDAVEQQGHRVEAALAVGTVGDVADPGLQLGGLLPGLAQGDGELLLSLLGVVEVVLGLDVALGRGLERRPQGLGAALVVGLGVRGRGGDEQHREGSEQGQDRLEPAQESRRHGLPPKS